ncbi:MAG: GIY-YIG nuclease family protein [SAR202 cluster bacterium]|nr:GIY-YIG nuclease family protein [SAR202 cluster bacterium]MDP6799821.1 GIY-YIG nuclease family protein [SAR202 cluster bacterium]
MSAESSALQREWQSMAGLVPTLGPGAYCVLFELDVELTIETGRLGSVSYAAGAYAYVGSAMKGISARLPHHLRPPKRPHWHMDYLRPKGRPTAIVVAESDLQVECAIARHLDNGFTVVRDFGSSDCRCAGHLFHGKDPGALLGASVEAVEAIGCRALVITPPVAGDWEKAVRDGVADSAQA